MDTGDIDGTDYCGHCKRVTGNRAERQVGRTAFICVDCGHETDACYDDWDEGWGEGDPMAIPGETPPPSPTESPR